ncbi:MAG: TonB-dependent receptor [Candidatus Glassbacteria bacterium]|nr:TonB-dependent receptor [Candidatus Glassbacteria bacterium]
MRYHRWGKLKVRGGNFSYSAALILAALFLCATAELGAQGPARGRFDITGYVRDEESDEALPYANIIIVGTSQGAATNQDGYFVIVNPPADTCRLRITYVGYATREILVDPRRASDRRQTILMRRQTIEMEGLTVESEVPPIMEVVGEPGQIAISPAEIAVLPNMGEVDLFRSFQLMPGISGVSDGSSGLYVRGGTPDQNLILFDGMTIYHVDHFFGLFSAFNADAVKDIRVYKGGFPAEFGGRISSVVNMTGKSGDASGINYGGGINLLSGHGMVEGPLGNAGSFLVTIRRSYTDVIRSGLYSKLFDFVSSPGSGISAENPFVSTGTEEPDFYFYDLNGKVTFNPRANDVLSLSIYNGRDNLGQANLLAGEDFAWQGEERLLEDDQATLNTLKRTRWGNLGLSAKYSGKINDRYYASLLVSHTRYFSDYSLARDFQSNSAADSLAYFRSAASAVSEDNELTDFTVQFDNEIHPVSGHDLKVGAGFSKLDAHYYSILNDTTDLLRRESSANLGSAYLQDRWHVTNDLDLTFGLRGTYYDKTAESFVEPRASAVFSLTDYLRLKGAWGRYHQFVNRITNEDVLEGSRDFWLLADEDNETGFAEHWIAGLSLENTDWLLDVEGYYKDLEGVVEYTRRASYNRNLLEELRDEEVAPGTAFFQGTGFSKGIDILFQKKRGKFTGWIGYSLSRVRYDVPGLNGGKPYPATHDRTHEVNVVAKLSLKHWDFAATWVFATGKAYSAPESQYYLQLLNNEHQGYIHVSDRNAHRLSDYHRLDLSVSRNFTSAAFDYTIGLSVFNVYDRNNFWFRQFNLDTVPVSISDVSMLSLTPTIYFKIYSR